MPWFKDDKTFTKISSLNIFSLLKHLEDIKADWALLKSDIICLTETWIQPDSDFDFGIDGYNVFLNNIGFGKGIAIYAKSSFSHVLNSNGEGFQITKMTSEKMDVICIYRSENGSIKQLLSQLFSILTPQRPTFICGDFNLCVLKNPNNSMKNKIRQI